MSPKTRQSDRRETLAYWPAFNEYTGKKVGLLTDISEGGIQLHSEAPFLPDQRISLVISPPSPLTGAKEIRFTVQTIWCRPAIEPHLYHAGFKIVRITPRARAALEKLQNAFSFVTPSQPLLRQTASRPN